MRISSLLSLTTLSTGLKLASAFDEKCDSNFVTYWGQNSYGITNADRTKWEKPLRGYCEDDTLDVINLSFLNVFNAGTQSPPQINLSFHCDTTTFPGTSLVSCPDIGSDIAYCQSKGKKILMSLGGATGSYGFQGDTDATAFAQTLWDLLLGGSSAKRPFGTAKLDGIDLDIEGGSSNGYSTFIKALRELYAQDSSKKYYITGAPQCPFPDIFMGPALDNAWFDMVFVQFYNNHCSASNPANFNFGQWNTWATTKSVNKNVKVYLGIPGSPSSAGSGYIPATQVNQIVDDIRKKYPSFGGVMAWDASSSDMNIEGGSSFAAAIKKNLKASSACGPQINPNPPSSLPTTQTSSSSSPPSTPTPPTSSLPSAPVTTSQTSPPSSIPSLLPSSASASLMLPSSSLVATSVSGQIPSTVTSIPLSNLDQVVPSDPKCPIEGTPCEGNEVSCNGYNYAVCSNGYWLLRPCSTDQVLSCAKGNSGIYCDWATGNSIKTCSVSSALYRRKIAIEEAQEMNTDTMIDFVKGKDDQVSDRVALLKIRTTLNTPISRNWLVKLAIPDNVDITSVSRGHFEQDGSTVVIKSNIGDEPIQNMGFLIEIKGNILTQPRPILDSKRPFRAQFQDLGSV